MENIYNIEFKRKLPIPQEIKKEMPLSKEAEELKTKRDAEIADIFCGRDDRFILIIGPCSADHADSVLDYIHRLADVQKEVSDKILIIPRIYTGKPRTTGEGYKGMLHQPDPDKKPDMLEGIKAIRKLHKDAIEQTGFTCADEMLYPQNYRYLSDLLSYVAIGARSVENQEHRLVSSGMDIPVGMKNPTSGDLSIMLNSIKAAQSGHTFLYRGWEVKSKGNPLPTLYSEAASASTATTTRTITMRTSDSSLICTAREDMKILLLSLTPTTQIQARNILSR